MTGNINILNDNHVIKRNYLILFKFSNVQIIITHVVMVNSHQVISIFNQNNNS